MAITPECHTARHHEEGFVGRSPETQRAWERKWELEPREFDKDLKAARFKSFRKEALI